MTWRARAWLTAAFTAAAFWGGALAPSNGHAASVWHTPRGAAIAIEADSHHLDAVQCYGYGRNRGRRYRRFECSATAGRTWYTFGAYFSTRGIWYQPHDSGRTQ